MPHRIYTNYKCDTGCRTGYIKITSVARCLQSLAKSQFITDSNASQDNSSPQVSRLTYIKKFTSFHYFILWAWTLGFCACRWKNSLVQLDGVQVQQVQCRSLSLANIVLNEIDTANVMLKLTLKTKIIHTQLLIKIHLLYNTHKDYNYQLTELHAKYDQ